MIGANFIILALFLGEHLMGIIYLLPMSALGILLIFAGAQLGLPYWKTIRVIFSFLSFALCAKLIHKYFHS